MDIKIMNIKTLLTSAFDWYIKECKPYGGIEDEWAADEFMGTKQFKEMKTKSIDKVTTERLEMAFKMVGIQLSTPTIDTIIDIVELLEEKGGATNLADIAKLQEAWEMNKNS